MLNQVVSKALTRPESTKGRMIGSRLPHEPRIFITQRLTHRHHAEVLEQATEERFFSSRRSEMLTQGARGRRRIETSAPVPSVVEARVSGALQRGGQRKAKGESLDGTLPEYKEGPSDRANLLQLAKRGRISGFEDLARQGRVVPERLGNPLHVDILLSKTDDLDRNSWEAWQPRRFKNPV